jgi:DNA polymerase-3 subunit epsilon
MFAAPKGDAHMNGYTVLDLETTGLHPAYHDRVVEVGLVFVDDAGAIEGRWSTLVNPGRDVGPTQIHGISARDVLDAPHFGDIAGALLDALQGRTVVAHNARFDLLFLAHELTRLDLLINPEPIVGLCTMQWAPRMFPSASRKLVDCCSAAGVECLQHHSALGDAEATAQLLALMIQKSSPAPPWEDVLAETAAYPWPAWPESTTAALVSRTTGAPERPGTWLDRIVAGMPHWDDLRVESYLEVLESALLDRYLSAHEEKALVETAVGLGLDRSRLGAIHLDYLRAMAGVALADGVVTETERSDLNQVAQLIGLSPADLDEALASAGPHQSDSGFALKQGDAICLTGDMDRPRSEWEQMATARGLKVGGLTKKTKVLIAADPDSQSGKAAKARKYGVPIINEGALERLLGNGRA